jgi:hypothetical protein
LVATINQWGGLIAVGSDDQPMGWHWLRQSTNGAMGRRWQQQSTSNGGGDSINQQMGRFGSDNQPLNCSGGSDNQPMGQ